MTIDDEYAQSKTLFASAIQKQAPGTRARFLKNAYASDAESFFKRTPDEILLKEFGASVYADLFAQKLVPIAAVPSCLTELAQ